MTRTGDTDLTAQSTSEARAEAAATAGVQGLLFDDKTEISARPSDSIALALRTGTPVFCTEEILAEAGIPVPDSEDDGADEVEEEEEVERFREFLDQVTPEDFDKS